MTNDHHKPEHQRPGSEAAPSAHGAASQTSPMDDALVEKVEARLRSLLEGWFPHSTASTWPDLARAAVQAVQEAQWPHASPEDAKGGWTISPSHLQRVQAAVEAANIGYPQWEEIEAILLFQAGMPLPSFPKEGDNG